MVSFELRVVWIERDRLVEVSAHHMVLKTQADVVAWRDELVRSLELLHHAHGEFALLICVDDVQIFPATAHEYGRVAQNVTRRFASRVARYGSPSLVRSIISAAAVNHAYPVNLFESRSQAVEFLRSARAS